MKRKKLLLISLDALCESDFETVRNLPNFSKIITEGAYCPHVNAVYPSLTFPCHTSIATGCTPDTHRIVNNYVFDPYAEKPSWNFYASNIKCKAIWDYARESGKRVLSMSWPVSSGAKMTYSIPEMSPAKPRIWNAQNFMRQVNIVRRYGTPGFAVRTMLETKGLTKAWFFGAQPDLDNLMMRSFEHNIVRRDFDIALLHIYGLDDAKHGNGIHGEKIDGYLRRYDAFLGRLMHYCDTRSDENITLIATGDHGQKNATWAIYGNMLLADMGLVTYENEHLSSYRVYLDSCDGMAYLYLADGADSELAEQAIMRFTSLPGVKKVMRPEEFAPLGCDHKAYAVIEAEDGYQFESGYKAAALSSDTRTVRSHYHGIHGYYPDTDGYRTMTWFYGQDVAPQQIPKMCITDILPSVLEWMQIPFGNMDGKAVPGLWK